jgi:hypothetical protein
MERHLQALHANEIGFDATEPKKSVCMSSKSKAIVLIGPPNVSSKIFATIKYVIQKCMQVPIREHFHSTWKKLECFGWVGNSCLFDNCSGNLE